MTAIPARIRQQVRERDAYTCARCGTYLGPFGLYSLQHRRARGMGGSKRADTNQPANLIVLCGSATSAGGCHNFIESHPDVAVSEGFRLFQTMNPDEHPVKTYRGWVQLNNDGTRSDVVSAS